MTDKDTVSNKELYSAIMNVQKDMNDKLDSLHLRMNNVIENRITPLEVWRANVTGQIAIFTLAIGFGVNLLFDWAKSKIKI